MVTVTVPDLREETLRALEQRALEHGHSTEAEIRKILEEAIRPETRVKIGSELAAFGLFYGGIDIAIERDDCPTGPASFE